MPGYDGEHHWQRQSSLPSSLIPHLLSGLQESRHSQTREYVSPTVLPRDEPILSQTSFDHGHRQFSSLDLMSENTRPRHLDRGQQDVLARLSTLRCCGLDPHLPPIFPERYRNPIRSSPFNHISTGPSTSPWTQRNYRDEEEYPYESPNAGALHWSDPYSNSAGSNGGSIQNVKADSADTDGNAKQSKKSRKTAIACECCRSKLFV